METGTYRAVHRGVRNMRIRYILKLMLDDIFQKKIMIILLFAMSSISIYMTDVIATRYFSNQYRINSMSSMFAVNPDKVNYVKYLNLMSPEYTPQIGDELIQYIRNYKGVVACGRFNNNKMILNGELVKTYYYSTSCGYTADVCAWGSDEDNYPQYASVRAGTSDYNADIKSEKTFEQFITAKDSSDYDSEADMYRWKTVIGISELTAHFNSLIGSYLRKNGSVYILENGEPSDKVVNDIGNIASIKVIERGCGGVVAALMVEGSKETCIVKGENAVRSLMGNNKCAIITQSREIYNDILPSAFCIFKPVYDNGTLVSYEITGGGYGHGIGMSQNAVKKMSETMDYTDILKFFYNNIEIKNIND